MTEYRTDEFPEPRALGDLRESVGWGRFDEDYPTVFAGYRCAVSVYEGGDLVGFGAVIGDGMRHAFLVDVIVRPDRQRRGIGLEIVRRAVDLVRASGATIVHVDFTPENAAFYARCGFRPSQAGILEIR